MEKGKLKHVKKIPLSRIKEPVRAEPKVPYTEKEIENVLKDLSGAVDKGTYIPQTPTVENPALSDDYIFDTNDENFVLKDLKRSNFVGKIIDNSNGAKRRKAKGLPQEYLYVFKYACKLMRRDSSLSNIKEEQILIYIKINNRKIPCKKVFVISFHKNRYTKKN